MDGAGAERDHGGPVALPLLLMMLAAEPARAKLTYDATGTSCPAREQLVSAVAARLGLDPFADDALVELRVQVRRTGRSLTAHVSQRGAGGAKRERELSSPTLDCSELFRAIELAVALAIDPRAGLVPLPPPKPEPMTAPPPPAPAVPEPEPEPVKPQPEPAPEPEVLKPLPAPEPAPAPVQPPGPALDWHLGVAPAFSLNTGPGPTFGAVLLAGLHRGYFEANVGGRVELGSSLDAKPGQVQTQLTLGSLDVCVAVQWVRGCVLADVGALRVTSSGLASPAHTAALYADLGARLAVELPVSRQLVVRPFLDIATPVARATVLVDGAPVWSSPAFSGTLGVALMVRAGD